MIPEPDRLAQVPVRPDLVAQQGQPGVGGLPPELGGPLERGVRLGHETPMDTVQRMSRRPDTSRPVRITSNGHGRDLHHVLVGLGGKPTHEVQLHLPPPGAVRSCDGADQVLFGDHLVDDLADAFAAALGAKVSRNAVRCGTTRWPGRC